MNGLILLIIVLNIFGIILGLDAYYYQLTTTPFMFWIFVIDCPLAAILFLLYLMGLTNPYFEAIMRCYALKYGIWTIIVIFSSSEFLNYSFTWVNLLLHAGLIIESFTFMKKRLAAKHFIPALIILLTNDFLDYVIGIHPPINNSLFFETAFFTVFLSIFSVAVFVLFYKNNKNIKLE
ncbi:Uncharacterised protein [Candidatus Tiddalikarchaeum anstoanum]|nr:Uncharacterised protein [Candidatus Tiddalikarchaeum anstoanum]